MTPTLKPETVADLKQFIEAKFGMFGALHLKHQEENCPCEICKAIREVVAGLS
jgi:hypothetical protein